MKKKTICSLFLAVSLSLSVLGGCGNTTASEAQPSGSSAAVESSATTDASTTSETSAADTSASVTSEVSAVSSTAESTATEDNEAAAKQLMSDLTGSYQELWPVILADDYKQLWLDDCAALVGEDNAEGAYEKLSSMVTGEVYGEDAVKAYADGNGVYDCAFTEGVSKFEFDGATSTIKGYDADGNELFSHTYHYVGMEPIRGMYEYESDDADSGEFTYFCMAPDTNTTTYHIEFRYGSDLEALGQYDAGNYAYWLASGISTEYDQTMIENCIQLFCTENLSEQ